MENFDITGFSFVIIVMLIFWFVSGFIGSKIGARRGRPTAGFWLGFLFPVLGCLFALFLPRDVLQPTARIESSGQGVPARVCPLCGKRAEPYSRKCADCGNALT
jgi:hypothetical protein